MLKLTKQELQKKILDHFYKKGEKLFNKGAVIDCEIVDTDYNFVRLNSVIKDNGGTIQNIRITKDENFIIDGKCSCKIGHNCEHVVASCLYYIENLQNEEYSDIDFLLNSIDNNSLNEDEFLIYRLMGKSLYLYKSKMLKKDNLPSKGRQINIYYNNYRNLEDEIDKEISGMIKGLKDGYYDYLDNFKGQLGGTLIKTLIKHKKLYIGDSKEPAILKKLDKPLKLKFQKIEDKYRVKIATAKKLILSNPPFLINPNENCLEEINVDGNKLDKILSLPQLEFEEIPKVANSILKHLENVEIKLPKEFEIKEIKSEVIPKILLFNNYFKLEFKYDDYFLPFYPQKEKKEFFENSYKIELFRKLEKENEFKNFIEKEFNFEFEKVNNNIIVSLEKSSKNLTSWSLFLNRLEELENNGWIIEKNSEFDLFFDDESQIVVETDEDEEGWFNLSFDFEFNGKKIPLAPLITSFLNEFDDIENLPEKLFLEVEENYFVEVESIELKPVIKTIIALFDKKDNNDLKISLADAVLLDELDDLEIKGSRKLLEIAKKLKNFDGIKKVNPPKNLNAELRDYQKEGLNWLNFLWEYSFNGILADDMGLGKTIQTLSHLLRLKEENQLTTSLIIVPTSLLANWKNEIEQFTPNLSKIIYYGNDRSEIFDELKNYDIIITTYSILTRDILKLKEIKFDYVILDEAQKIKNPRAKVTMGVKLLKAKHKLALSGTPIENNLAEIWSIFSFLMPGFLGNLKLFKELFQNPIERENDFSKRELLHKKLKPFILRRTKEKVVIELPAKTEIIKYTQFSAKQAKLYETIRVTMEKKVKEAIEKRGLNKSQITILDALLKLRQVCCDPRLLKVDTKIKKLNESAKLELFLEIVDELLLENRKILVFSQFTSMLEIIEEELQKKEIEFVKLTGKTRNREEVINRFKNENIPIFLISLKAGGIGLNLTEADSVIHYDPWWNPAVENQATDRAYRIGQDKAVFVYKLIVENTIEQKIIELQKKKAQMQKIIDNEDSVNFDKNELLELLK